MTALIPDQPKVIHYLSWSGLLCGAKAKPIHLRKGRWIGPNYVMHRDKASEVTCLNCQKLLPTY